MEWVRGVSLTSFIEKHLSQPKAISKLAAKWRAMIAALKASGIAHGDLQHGNILIAGDEIKLVDYDGMYVPGLAGMRSNETGHPNYQHPHRMGSHFGEHLDSFSAWVIHLSLLALAADPELWEQTSRGDEALIFRKKDYDFPAQSRALGLVKASKDTEVRRLARRFLEILRLPLLQVPSLDDKQPSAPKSARKAAPKTVAPSPPAPTRARGTSPSASTPKSAPPHESSPKPATTGPSRRRSEHIPAAWLAGGAQKSTAKAAPKTASPGAAVSAAPKSRTTGGPPTSSKRARPAHVPAAWGPQAAPGTAPGAAPAAAPPSPKPRHPVVRVLAAVWWVMWLLLRIVYFLVSRILWVLWQVVKYCSIGAYYVFRAVLWQAPGYFYRAVGRGYMRLSPPQRKRVLVAGAIIVTILGVALYFWHDALLETIMGGPAAPDVTGE
jgi:hypothetical protein